MAKCDGAGVEPGDLCEGDGECGTDNALNNCGADLDLGGDVYRVVARASCPRLEVVTPVGACPDDADIHDCATPGLQPGDLCEGDGRSPVVPRRRRGSTDAA